jgi:hypothetical protein
MRSWQQVHRPTDEVPSRGDHAARGRMLPLVLAVGLGLALLPSGAKAASAFLNVFVADPVQTGNKAHVDTAGGLLVSGEQDRQVFQTELSFSIPDGSFVGSEQFQVPAGKRLVMRFASMNAQAPTGERIVSVTIQSHAGSTTLIPGAFLVPEFTGTSDTFDSFEAAQDLLAYADAGTPVGVQAARNSNSGEVTVLFSVYGYLVDCTTTLPCNQ